ncbi:MAG: hypothetical protein WCS20_14580 [Alphaproteobacteria bacterium]
MMISALRTSGAFLALPVALALLGWPQLAFGWAVLLQFPPFFLVLVISSIFLIANGIVHLRPASFVIFGLVLAFIALLVGLSSILFELSALPSGLSQTALIVASSFVPFAVIQFVLALFVRPRAPST